MKYRVGDIVQYNNLSGRIVHIIGTSAIMYGVEYSCPIIAGHDCQGHGMSGCCYYEIEDQLTLLKKVGQQEFDF